MTEPLRQAIPYLPDSAPIYELLRDESWPVFLDSGRPHSSQGRYDLLAADPYLRLITHGNTTEIADRTGGRQLDVEPLNLLREAIQPQADGFADLPFCGGAIGYFGYDLGRRFEALPELAEDVDRLPEMVIGIYDWVVIVDHEMHQSWLVGQGRDPRTRKRWDELVRRFCHPPAPDGVARKAFRVAGKVRSNMDREGYARGFERIQRYIKDGDCYQVNFAQRFEVEVEGDPWAAYCALRRSNPAPYAAYLHYPFAQILSCSPERFLKLRAGEVETKPIKGTCRRGQNAQEDMRLAEALKNSDKNRAENLMIVDLLRNDLGKSCVPGSITVPRLFEVESFATVHHLVSTVTGRLAAGCDALDLLRGCFPGGSITGAPKLRAMQIIEELEPQRRGVYCGAIGYLGFDGGMDTNIAIRTLAHSEGRLSFGAGGGIVADSVMEEEYQESFLKAEAMLSMLRRMPE